MTDNSQEQGSVSHWLEGMKNQDQESIRKLWDRYFDKLVTIARTKMPSDANPISDEEDIAMSVFCALNNAAANNRLNELTNRNELWALLLTITQRKIINAHRYNSAQKRNTMRTQNETDMNSAFASTQIFNMDLLASQDPTPETLSILNEQFRSLIEQLNDVKLQKIAIKKMEGYKNEEISRDIGVALRTTERKLKVIRKHWLKVLEDGP